MSTPDRSVAMKPDDPRLGAWVDGRLSPAEAAEVERIVNASAELSRTVADLRAIKAARPDGPVRPLEPGVVRQTTRGVDADDTEVASEWRRIEQERIAEERAEALEDVAGEKAVGGASACDRAGGRWPLTAMAAALAAGVVFALLINRPARMNEEQVKATGDELVGPLGPGRAAASAAARVPSSPVFGERTGQRVIRVYLRDGQGRGRLEEALAVGDLRIESSEPPADTARTEAAVAGPTEWLTVEGPQADIDAMLAALAESSESLAVEPLPPPPAAALDAAMNAAGTAGQPANPTYARLLFEIIDQPAGGGVTGAGDGPGRSQGKSDGN